MGAGRLTYETLYAFKMRSEMYIQNIKMENSKKKEKMGVGSLYDVDKNNALNFNKKKKQKM